MCTKVGIWHQDGLSLTKAHLDVPESLGPFGATVLCNRQDPNVKDESRLPYFSILDFPKWTDDPPVGL